MNLARKISFNTSTKEKSGSTPQKKTSFSFSGSLSRTFSQTRGSSIGRAADEVIDSVDTFTIVILLLISLVVCGTYYFLFCFKVSVLEFFSSNVSYPTFFFLAFFSLVCFFTICRMEEDLCTLTVFQAHSK
jgi:hypothetical protein